MVITEAILREKLEPVFSPVYLKVSDVSDCGCGAKFDLIIVSESFQGKPLLQRQRSVNDCLAEEIKQIHAITMKTYTPEQWEKVKNNQ